MKKYLHNIHSKQKGFTLLFAVLVSTLVVSISASITSIALRQTILSGTSRESQYAFYAANTVLECAFYWDITNANVFPPPDEDQLVSTDTGADTIKCAGGNIITGDGFSSSQPWNLHAADDINGEVDVTTIYIQIQDKGTIKKNNTARCAQATVTKTEEPGGKIQTRIEAKGYNSCDLNHPRTVERGLVQIYTS